MTRRQHGRIHTHQRNTNDHAELLGDAILVNDDHVEMVHTTEKLEINLKLQREYRNRISHIYTSFLLRVSIRIIMQWESEK